MSKKIKLIGISVVAIALLGVATFFAFSKGFFGGNRQSGESQVITTSDQGGSCLVTYFPTNGDIEITIGDQNSDVEESGIVVDPDPANWRVRDIYGNTVEAEVVLSDDKLTIKAPEGGYESGGIYVLDIGENAKFVGDGFGNSRHMVFGVDRGESETVVLNDNVYEIETDKVSISGEAVTVEGAYKESDILIGDFDGDGLNEAIGLVNIKEANGRTEAEYVSPTPEEVYKELDIFVAKYVDFAGGEFEEGIETGADQTGIAGLLGKFTDTVYAEEDKSSAENDEKLSGWNIDGKPGFRDSDINGETISAPYLTITGEYKKDLVDIGFKIDTEVPILVVANKGVAYLDLEIRNNSTLDVNVGKELVIDPDKETDDEMLKKFEENKNAPKQELGGKKDIKKDIDIPLGPTGSIIKELLNIRVDVFSEVGVDLSAQFKNNISANAGLYMRAWYVYKGSEKGDYDSGFDYSISAVMINDLSGKAELFAGVGLRLSAGYPALVEFKGEGSVGPYVDINGAVHIETKFSTPPKKFDFDWRGMLSVEGGVKAKASVNAIHDGWGIIVEDFDKELLHVEKKFPILSESTPKPILNIGLKDSYTVNDGKLMLNDIDVTYIDMISDEEEVSQLKAGEYDVYIDGGKISDLNKLGSKESSVGKHTLKLAWKHDDSAYEYEKEVEFAEGASVAWVVEPTEIQYKEVLDYFYDQHMNGWPDYDESGILKQQTDNEHAPFRVGYIIPMFYRNEEVYYGFIDLDEDGIKELVISTQPEGTSYGDEHGIGWDNIYTVRNGKFVMLAYSGERSSYGIREDKTIMYHGSSGYDDTNLILYILEKGKDEFTLVKSIHNTKSSEEEKADWERTIGSVKGMRLDLKPLSEYGDAYTQQTTTSQTTGGFAGSLLNQEADIIYKEVLDSLADGTGYQLYGSDGYRAVDPAEYAFVDLNQDGKPELLVASIDEMDAGRRYVTVFYYDSNRKSVKQATGGLMFGVAGAGGYRGSLGIYKNAEGKEVLIERSWASASGAGDDYQVHLSNDGTIEKVFFGDFQIGDDNKMATELTPIEWSDIEKSTGYTSGETQDTLTVRVTVDGGLYFRSGPGTEYSKVIADVVPEGYELKIIKVDKDSNGDEWGYTEFAGRKGWIILKHTERVNN